MGLIGFALTAGLAAATGMAVAAYAGTGGLGAFLVAVLQAMAAVWTAGVVLHRLTPGTILALHAAFTSLALLSTMLLGRGPARRQAGAAGPPAGEVRAPRPAWFWLLLAVAAGETLWTVARAVVFPPYAWDGLTYHLPAAALWVQQGYIGQLDWNQIWVNVYPENVELLLAWCFVFVRGQTLVQLVQLPFGLAGAVATAALGRQAGLGRDAAAFAGLAFYLAPIVLAQSGVPYVDLAYAALFLIAVFFALKGRPLWAGTALGLLAGVKTSGVGYAAVTILLATALAPRGQRRRTLIAMAVPLGLLGSFWYLRTWVHYGNPIYPILVPHLFAGQGSLAELVEIINTPTAFRGHPLYALFAAWFEHANVWNYDVRVAGFGPLWPVAALPALPYFLAHRRQPAWRLFLYLAAAFIIQPMRWWTRYAIALFPLGAVALGSVLESDDRWLRRTVLAISLGLVLVGSALGTVRQPGLGPRKFLAALHEPRQFRMTRLGVYYGPEYRWLEDVDPGGVRIAAVQVYFTYVLLGEGLQNRLTPTVSDAQYLMAPDTWAALSGWRVFARSPGWRVFVRDGGSEP